MIRIDFSEQDIKKIKQLRYDDPHPRVRRRMDVLWLKSQGFAHGEICRLTGISSNTLRKYLGIFQSGGVEKLTELNFYTPTSELEQHRHRLLINEAMKKIEELTGIKRSPSAVGRFLNALGMRPRKIGAIPSKADPQEQEAFRVNKLEPRLEEAREGKRAIFLSMPPISYSDLFSVFCGHSCASSYRPRPGEDVSTFSVH